MSFTLPRLVQGVGGLIALYSVYNLYVTSLSINQLGKYENMSKNAAKVSQTAANELFETRKTMAGATIAFSISLAASSALLILSPALPWVTLTSLFGGILYAVKMDVSAYWKEKKSITSVIPGVEMYNEALERNKVLSGNMGTLAAGWLALEVLGWAAMFMG